MSLDKQLILFILTACVMSELPQGLEVSIVDTKTTTVIFDGSKLKDQFDLAISAQIQSCSPIPSFQFQKGQAHSSFELELMNIGNTIYEIDDVWVVSNFDEKLINVEVYRNPTNPEALNKGDEAKYTINHTCRSDEAYTYTNYWSNVEIKMTFNKNQTYLILNYEFTCDSTYRIILFNWSLFLVIMVTTLSVTVFARFSRIYCFNWVIKRDQFSVTYFQGFKLNIFYVLAYGVTYLIAATMISINGSDIEIPAIILVTIIILLCSTFQINEFLVEVPKHLGFQKILFRRVRLCDVISVVIATILVIFYFQTRKIWYLNDFIALLVTGACVKLFKFCSFKQALIVMLSCAALDGICGLIIHILNDQSYDILVLKDFNYPIEFQLPMLQTVFDKRCAWISVANVILPGLIISYSIRFDKNRNTTIYTLLSFIGLLIGSIIWITIQAFNRHQWPQSLLTYPFMLLLTGLCSQKRDEFRIFYHGSFYDQYLMSPPKQKNKLLDDNQIYTEDEIEDIPTQLKYLITSDRQANMNSTAVRIDKSLFRGLNSESISKSLILEQDELIQSTIINDML